MNAPALTLRPDYSKLEREMSRSFVRAVIAAAHAKSNNRINAADFVARVWGDDSTASLIVKAATAPTTTDTAVGLSQITKIFLASLTGMSAAADLLSRGHQLSFARSASINVPNITAPVAAFVREGGPIPVAQAATNAGLMLTPFKLAVIVAATSEMLDSPNVETLFRAAMVESVGPSLDAAMFSGDPGDPDLRPPGLLNGIAALTPTVGGDANAMKHDLQALISAIAGVAGNGSAVFITRPEQEIGISALLRFRYPVLVSAQLATGVVIAIAVNALASSVEGAPRIDLGKEAVLHMEGTAPMPISSPGSPPVVAAPSRSLAQTDSNALRMRLPCTWGLRSPNAVAWMSGVTW